MKRRFLTLIMVFFLLIPTILPVLATQTEETDPTEETTQETRPQYSTATSGSCGKNVTWRLDGHTLVISGSGEIDAGSPWEFYKDTIHTLILDGDITIIGDEAFSTCNNLQYVDFGSALKEIGYRAFFSCNALEAFRLPETFRKFGPECFMDCENLQVIYCDGPMPSFKSSCLYTNHTVRVLYSGINPWPYEEVERLSSNFGARLSVEPGSPEALDEYLADADFSVEPAAATVPETTVPAETEPAAPIAESTAPAAPETEPTVPATTPPPPEPTQTPTLGSLELAPEEMIPQDTQPQPAAETEPLLLQQEEAEEEAQSRPVWFWAIIAAAVITGILILALLIRMVAHSGGRYSS